jgi:transcriptional regulator with XRE-family HTH domain
MYNKEIGYRLKMSREIKKLRQEDVAEIIGSTPQKISSMETGRTRVDLETLVKLCEIYDIEPDYILTTKRNTVLLLPNEMDLVLKYRQLPEIIREVIMDLIDVKLKKAAAPVPPDLRDEQETASL